MSYYNYHLYDNRDLIGAVCRVYPSTGTIMWMFNALLYAKSPCAWPELVRVESADQLRNGGSTIRTP